ncbi:rho GTPase-activating protein 19 [Salvelinus sp. IW2-2015]|uniref:rho GTPase-activating protein 19 n=1 Tax=Salvelinus sp. IW2-2015 TaxID=2691554 RepID=UPI000CEA99D2|nr:rho GTPase-activating protein 19-like [Salvelinus alpinus]
MDMAAEKEPNENKSVVNSQDPAPQPVIFNPEFFVERLKHERPQVFTELVLSNITRLIDLPGDEFAQLTGEADPRLPTAHIGFLRSLNFLKRKDKGVVFGAPLTEEGIAQIHQLIEYLSKNLHVEGLFRVPGHSLRQAALREMLNAGTEIDLETGDFHPNDAATLLKAFLGELPEPLLTHRHYHAYLKIAELTQFDEKGNKTSVPDKERQIEAFQLLFMLLPPANHSLLKLLLDLLYHTARNQHNNKMSAINLATMVAPHIIWPKHLQASDLQGNIKKLNNAVAFLIKHSQKLFRAPVYVKEHAHMHFKGSTTSQFTDGLALCGGGAHPSPSKRAGEAVTCIDGTTSSNTHTELALRELYQQVSSMPESAKKKKLIRQFAKQVPGTPLSDQQTLYSNRKHRRSRSFGGIRRRALGTQGPVETASSSLVTPGSSSSADRQEKEDSSVGWDSSSLKRMCFSPTQETSV